MDSNTLAEQNGTSEPTNTVEETSELSSPAQNDGDDGKGINCINFVSHRLSSAIDAILV